MGLDAVGSAGSICEEYIETGWEVMQQYAPVFGEAINKTHGIFSQFLQNIKTACEECTYTSTSSQ